MKALPESLNGISDWGEHRGASAHEMKLSSITAEALRRGRAILIENLQFEKKYARVGLEERNPLIHRDLGPPSHTGPDPVLPSKPPHRTPSVSTKLSMSVSCGLWAHNNIPPLLLGFEEPDCECSCKFKIKIKTDLDFTVVIHTKNIWKADIVNSLLFVHFYHRFIIYSCHILSHYPFKLSQVK